MKELTKFTKIFEMLERRDGNVLNFLEDLKLPRFTALRTADLSGEDLSGLDFSGMDLSEANLHGCNLAGCNFFLTNLSEAKLDIKGLDRTKHFGFALLPEEMYLNEASSVFRRLGTAAQLWKPIPFGFLQAFEDARNGIFADRIAENAIELNSSFILADVNEDSPDNLRMLNSYIKFLDRCVLKGPGFGYAELGNRIDPSMVLHLASEKFGKFPRSSELDHRIFQYMDDVAEFILVISFESQMLIEMDVVSFERLFDFKLIGALSLEQIYIDLRYLELSLLRIGRKDISISNCNMKLDRISVCNKYYKNPTFGMKHSLIAEAFLAFQGSDTQRLNSVRDKWFGIVQPFRAKWIKRFFEALLFNNLPENLKQFACRVLESEPLKQKLDTLDQ